ncbi:type II secretion system F family protein [Deferribacter autotrophicus]|uniref:Type II secretion system F family protein n=1 Tax=Deferribacter autotrophicus TaxID=500465 RepID=A0A5A8F223_9BACT|nr:type II secretion system F family protein [Deferribacter autotrophicus]KAA0257365.1 type II secretion system F family protein [Deferribacter autotrophicus]
MRFYYSAVAPRGQKVTGSLEAISKEDALRMLLDEGLDIEEIRQYTTIDFLKENFKNLSRKFTNVKLEELIVFTRQFATLFSSGIPVLKILERLSSQNFSDKLLTALRQIKNDVEAGLSLSAAFSRHKNIFSPLYINMIKVGEEGGVLDITLQRLASILESDLETRNRIKTATRYPKLVVSAIVIAFTILVTFVIPKFANMFARFKTELPLPTKILIWINKFVQGYWYIIIFIILFSIFAFKKYKKTEEGKKKIDEYIFKVPIIGPLVHKIYISRIARILALLYKSGINISKSFDIVSEISGNETLKRELLMIKEQVARGSNISSAFKRSKYFPPVVSDMIESGEETGNLDDMLFKVADYYDEEIDYSIKTLSQAIEPILLIFIAGMVILLALGVFLPMWDMIKAFR